MAQDPPHRVQRKTVVRPTRLHVRHRSPHSRPQTTAVRLRARSSECPRLVSSYAPSSAHSVKTVWLNGWRPRCVLQTRRFTLRSGQEQSQTGPATTVSGVSSQIGGGEKLRRDLENTGLPLLPTDVSNDLVDVGGIHRVNLRHIAELPMMGFHSDRCRALERCIAVVIGLVDLMDQWRALLCALTLWTMTGRTIRVELRL